MSTQTMTKIKVFFSPYATHKILTRLARCGFLVCAKPLTRRQMLFLPRKFWRLDTILWGMTDKRFRDTADIIMELMKQKTPKYGRNDACPCGSGKKFKHCCIERLKGDQA